MQKVAGIQATNVNELDVIELEGKRVLTTSQLARSFETESKVINRNFQRNSDRYTAGKHYFSLTGEELKEFKGSRQIDDNLKYASVLYLWTEKGAWLHAKSLNTDRAWDAYEMLVDDYYRVKESIVDLSMLSPELRTLINIEKTQIEQNRRIERVEKQQESIREVVATVPKNWRRWVNNIITKISKTKNHLDAYKETRNESYELLEVRGRCDLRTRLKNMRERMAEVGKSKTSINRVNKMDVIESDTRLMEIYVAIIKEMAIKYGIGDEL